MYLTLKEFDVIVNSIYCPDVCNSILANLIWLRGCLGVVLTIELATSNNLNHTTCDIIGNRIQVYDFYMGSS